ncbi:MAG: glycoside hydrolase family 88 protein [Paenibacillaceae bacterium]
MSYFPIEQSSYNLFRGDIKQTLQLIADRYINHQPKQPYVYRASHQNSITRNEDYRYEFDMDRILPDIQEGQYVYAWAKLWCDQDCEWAFSASCFGPLRLYVNGQLAFKSNILEDVFPDRRSWFRIKLSSGWNSFVIQFIKTGTGCGGRFGTGSIKGLPLHFIIPSEERCGQEGWIFTRPLNQELATLPMEGMSEMDTGIQWLPNTEWNRTELAMGSFARLYGMQSGQSAFAWTKLTSIFSDLRMIDLKGEHFGSMTLYWDGQMIYNAERSGSFRVTVPVQCDDHHMVVKSCCNDNQWGFVFESPPEGIHISTPEIVHGAKGDWLYLGCFKEESELDIRDLCVMNTVFQSSDGGTYWKVDMPDTVVRPFLETTHYARWNYPLGVTLYGLMKTGMEFERREYVEYVLEHIEQCTSYDQYALWDKETYGASGINHQLSAIDSLDDCGSFAATMLYAMEQRELEGAKNVADRIAHYISYTQDRLEEGALFRVHGSSEFMQETMWCDDLYMSTPFLSRYYQLTGDTSYVDDAARQFLLYKKYLFMSDIKIMSHVYDFKFNKQTRVPWGRGNGWVLFSLTELLAVLPSNHVQREELLLFFMELCEGYLALQGTNGLWHQVLNMQDSYEETSCTSMFIYAFARGIRFGWITDSEPYTQAVLKGWEGLAKHSIDSSGNIYGVCRGSGYSFSPLYYKDDLTWNLNDTHGIGIIMLAGVEVFQLVSMLET